MIAAAPLTCRHGHDVVAVEIINLVLINAADPRGVVDEAVPVRYAAAVTARRALLELTDTDGMYRVQQHHADGCRTMVTPEDQAATPAEMFAYLAPTAPAAEVADVVAAPVTESRKAFRQGPNGFEAEVRMTNRGGLSVWGICHDAIKTARFLAPALRDDAALTAFASATTKLHEAYDERTTAATTVYLTRPEVAAVLCQIVHHLAVLDVISHSNNGIPHVWDVMNTLTALTR